MPRHREEPLLRVHTHRLLYTLISYCTPTCCSQCRCRCLNHAHRNTCANPPAAYCARARMRLGRHSHPRACCSSHTHVDHSIYTHARVQAGTSPSQAGTSHPALLRSHAHRRSVLAACPQTVIHRNIPVSSKHPRLSLKPHSLDLH